MAKSPSSRQQPASSEFGLDPSLSLLPDHQQPTSKSLNSASIDSSTIRERERNQLRVVAESLAPQLVLEQSLSVPGAPPTLRHCLANDAPILAISVLRACLNEASTNALFSSATSLDASQEDTTRLLNEVDTFQSTLLGLLDEVQRRYTAEERRTHGSNGIKREVEGEQDSQPAKVKKYMLHRGGANGGDLFTSAAFLSDRDLEQLSLLPDADLVAVHPPSADSSPLVSSSAPSPSLGAVHPQFTPTPTYLPVSMRYNLAPGQAPAIAPLLPALVAPPAPRTNSITSLSLVRETRMLDYGVWTSGFGCAPKFDSAGSTDGGYHRAASRAAGRERVKRWEKGLVAPEPLPRIRVDDPATSAAASADEFVLTKDERTTLEGMEVEIEQFLKFTRQAQDDEAKVWRVLERNLELIQRLGTAQIARTRKGVKKEERRRKAEIKKTTAAAAAATTNGVDGGDEEVREEGRRDLAEGVEKQDADTLLESFASLLRSFCASSVLPSITSGQASAVGRPSPTLVPAASLIRSITPLVVGELHREPSYFGAFDPVPNQEIRAGGAAAGGGWEKAVKESSGGGGGHGGSIIKQE
ncbi:hypothetical protein JCM3766R1_005928 [Sporobolomyces carnicolor]